MHPLQTPNRPWSCIGIDFGGLIAARPKGVRTPVHTPKKNGVQPLHAALERRAEAARPSLQAARHSHAFNRRATLPDRRAEPARLSGGRAKPARPSDRRAGFARLSAHISLSIREAYVSQPRPVPLELTWAWVQKPATKFNHPDPQENDRPRRTDTHQIQQSR
ncbi:hypothetical protein PCANC_04212 [Puccinia coronata f. sp. avenae]|uniref:Uncharacterized protein n=1 Tax=Puccinia coronata f. sp. avenae TaxID=200324 RepID=A0A2N5VX27_9BASI|nr:hypothetical protein PCANC_04212 [Puccinia coronata f. sp. avenae]